MTKCKYYFEDLEEKVDSGLLTRREASDITHDRLYEQKHYPMTRDEWEQQKREKWLTEL